MRFQLFFSLTLLIFMACSRNTLRNSYQQTRSGVNSGARSPNSLFLGDSQIIDNKINIVFDLDYTLVNPINYDHPKAIVLSNGDRYMVSPHALNFLESLKKRTDVNLYIFSGGEEARNLELLERIKTSENESLETLIQHVFSLQDLEVVASEGRFAERNKKNLSKLGFNLESTVLIDDVEKFIPADQQKNMLWLGNSYYYFETYQEALLAFNDTSFEQAYLPPSFEHWLADNQRFKLVQSLFDEVFNNYDKNPSVSFIEILNEHKNRYIAPDHKLSPFQKNLIVRSSSQIQTNKCHQFILNFAPSL